MSTPSSFYTKWNKRKPDPRILNDETISALRQLALLVGSRSGKGHPSTRRQRAAAMKALRLYAKVKTGYPFDFGRQYTKPKFPNRRTTHHITAADVIAPDQRRGG